MPITVLAQVTIVDLDQFLGVFSTDGHAKRAQHGCTSARVLRPLDMVDTVFVLLEWPDRASFDAFRNDPEVAPTMRRGGAQGPPTFTLFETVAEFDH